MAAWINADWITLCDDAPGREEYPALEVPYNVAERHTAPTLSFDLPTPPRPDRDDDARLLRAVDILQDALGHIRRLFGCEHLTPKSRQTAVIGCMLKAKRDIRRI